MSFIKIKRAGREAPTK